MTNCKMNEWKEIPQRNIISCAYWRINPVVGVAITCFFFAYVLLFTVIIFTYYCVILVQNVVFKPHIKIIV